MITKEHNEVLALKERIKELEAERDKLNAEMAYDAEHIKSLRAENERLRATNMEYARAIERATVQGMERAAEIAESDTFAPPYGIRLAKAIRAEIKPSTPPDS